MRLPGGQGAAFRAAGLILKPGGDPDEVAWLASVHDRVKQQGFRLARPTPARDGRWVVEGWWAQERLAGEHQPAHWAERVWACRDFHRAVRAIGKPAFLGRRTDPWAVADRMCWGEATVACHAVLRPSVQRLLDRLQPIDLPSQLIHGDFGGNLLFDAAAAPAVIDISPYWRPAGFALAILLIDAMVWESAPFDIVEFAADEPGLDQLMVRATLRRVLELDQHFAQLGDDHMAEITAYQPLLDWLDSRVAPST